MEKPIDHDKMSGATTVVGGAAKGALFGALLPLVAGAALIGGLFAAPAVTLGVAAAVVVTGVAAVVTAPIWMPIAGLGAAVGTIGGVSKVGKEQRAFDEKAQNIQQNTEVNMQQIQQQAYQAGTRDGQAQLVGQIQEAHAASQAQQTNFAAKHAQKGAVTPEQIVKQREAAATAPHLGA